MKNEQAARVNAPTSDLKSVQDLKNAYPKQFDTLGDFKHPAKLFIKKDARPFIDPLRKCPIHVKKKLRLELKKMEVNGVIHPVTQHTDWCSSLAFPTKKDGSLRFCIDPKKLNQSLKRCPHKIPTLEELNTEFANARVFSKLDARAGGQFTWIQTASYSPRSEHLLDATAGPDFLLD